jgi:hypothetical protein
MASGLLELPQGTTGGMASLNGHYVEKFLARQPEWRKLKEQCEARGEWLRPYAFRDSYSLRCHRFGVDVGAVAMAMATAWRCIRAATAGRRTRPPRQRLRRCSASSGAQYDWRG